MINRRDFLKKVLQGSASMALAPGLFSFSGKKNKVSEKSFYPQRKWPNSEKMGDFERSLDNLSPARRVFMVDELSPGDLPTYIMEEDNVKVSKKSDPQPITPMFFSPICYPQNWRIVFGARHIPNNCHNEYPHNTELIEQFELNHWTNKKGRECYIEIFESILKQETQKMVKLFDEVVAYNKNDFRINIGKINILDIFHNRFSSIEQHDLLVCSIIANPNTIELLAKKDKNEDLFSRDDKECQIQRKCLWGFLYTANILINENIPEKSVYFTASSEYGLVMPIRQLMSVLRDTRNNKSVGFEEMGMACLDSRIVAKMTIK